MAAQYTEFLINGHAMLSAQPGFKLEGRQEELHRLGSILMRQKANSVLLVGPGGAGASAICMGFEASKSDPDTPFDIISKRNFWLDTDNFFASGDPVTINENYRKLSQILQRTPDAVLIIDDMRDFIEATRNNHCSNLINALMHDIKARKYQVILETRDEDLDLVIKCHSDTRESFTMLDIGEPAGDELMSIVKNTAVRLERFHGIRIHEQAVETAVELTTKYRLNDLGLSRAQPDASLTLLDRALTRYRKDAHSNDPAIAALEVRLGKITAALESGETQKEFRNLSRDELESLKTDTRQELDRTLAEWQKLKAELRQLQIDQIDGEALIREKNEELEVLLAKEAEEDRRRETRGEGDRDEEQVSEAEKNVGDFMSFARRSGHESQAVQEIRQRIAQYEAAVGEQQKKYRAMMEKVNSRLELTRDHVLAQFSRLAKIPVSQLDQDERQKLLDLESTLKAQVFDQDHIVDRVTDSVIAANAGLADDNKPQFAYMFLGPSGVGKTHLAKVAAESLFGDARNMLRFDMSEYMEKHAAAKLIGAPPGYEGFEAGGILTNAVRRQPKCLILFDEIEKAHPSVFDLFLQILDDARLTDNLGRTVSFSETIIMMTTNVGTRHFLNPQISFEEAQALAYRDLDENYRPEFLNRFNGRRNIQCFKALSLPGIQKIARVELKKLNRKIARHGLALHMDDAALIEMTGDIYRPVEGARGVKGYIKDSIEPNLGRLILTNSGETGTIQIDYTSEDGIRMHPPSESSSVTAEALSGATSAKA